MLRRNEIRKGRGWAAVRRDERHNLAPEIAPHRKSSQARPRTKIDHKHDYVLIGKDEYSLPDSWYRDQYGPAGKPPSRYVGYRCSICRKTMSKKNLRYGYEYSKWYKLYRNYRGF